MAWGELPTFNDIAYQIHGPFVARVTGVATLVQFDHRVKMILAEHNRALAYLAEETRVRLRPIADAEWLSFFEYRRGEAMKALKGLSR